MKKNMLDIASGGLVRDKKTKMLTQRRKAKPLWMVARDREVIRLMHILQDAKLVADKVNEMEVMKGRKISERRVYQIVSEFRDQTTEEVETIDINELVAEARSRYELLINESMKMIAEAYAVKDPQAKIKAKGIALDKARQSQQALDQLLKAAGIYHEKIDIEHNININIRESKEWLKLEEAVLLFFKYGLMKKYGITLEPSDFLEFVDKCENDPVYLQMLKDSVAKDMAERESRSGSFVMAELSQEVVDVEYSEVSGEDGEYTPEIQADIEPRAADEEEGTGGEEKDSGSENIRTARETV